MIDNHIMIILREREREREREGARETLSEKMLSRIHCNYQ